MTLSISIQRTNNYQRQTELLYSMSFVAFLIYMILSRSMLYIYIKGVWKIVFVFCLLLLFLKEYLVSIISRLNAIQLVYICFLILIILRVAIGPRQNSVGMTFLFAFSARDIPFERIARIAFASIAITTIFVVLCAKAGLIYNYTLVEPTRVREYLGFNYALVVPAIFFNLVGLWLYIKKEKLPLYHSVILLLINYYLYKKTDSRLSFLLTSLLIIAFILIKISPDFWRRRKLLCYTMVFAFVIGAATSILLTAMIDPSVGWQDKIDMLLVRRLTLGKESLETYGVSLFGNRGIEWVGNGLNEYGQTKDGSYLYVDSYYIQIMQKYGLIVFLSIAAIYTIASYNCLKRADIFLLSILAIRALHCIVDDSSQYLDLNTFWLAIGGLVMNNSCHKNYTESNQLKTG